MVNVVLATRGLARIPVVFGQSPVTATTADGRSWILTGDGVLDYQAPFNTPVTYSDVTGSITLTAVLGSSDAVMSMRGDVIPVFRREGRERDRDRSVHVMWPAGSRYAHVRRAQVEREWDEGINLMVENPHASGFLHALEAGTVIILHDQSRCHVRGCSIPSFRVFEITKEAESYAGFSEAGETASFALEGVTGSLATVVPVTVWGDLVEQGTWQTVGGHGSWGDVLEMSVTR